MTKSYFRSPLGWIEAGHSGRFLASLSFVAKRPRQGAPVQGSLRRQLQAYFRGSKALFRVRLEEKGTKLQKRVWKVLRSIPRGKTRSYKEVAARIGRAKAVRAVASACARNPIMLITPCHRVISSSGKLAGYAYGLKKKAWLLRHEGSSR